MVKGNLKFGNLFLSVNYLNWILQYLKIASKRLIKLSKNIGLIIKFDDVKYSAKKRDLLFGQMLLCMCEIAQRQGVIYEKRTSKKKKAII